MSGIKTVIMAGGKGTRISSIANDIPKPMIKVNGMPVLEHEIRNLSRQGFKDIIITVGYLAESIIGYFGNGQKRSPATGENFGVNIEYYIEEEPMGNAGAIYKIKEKLSEHFLLLNGDAISDVDFNRFYNYHLQKRGDATILTHPNSHPYDSGLIICDKNKVVKEWLAKEEKRPLYYKNRVNAGVHFLKKEILNNHPPKLSVDLDREVLKPLVKTGGLVCYDSTEYVKDMGTPERYFAVERDCKRGVIFDRNYRNKQKAVFLDRDGTINKYVGFLKNIDDFEILPGVSEAIKRINESGFLAIVVTNQPIIARGEMSEKELEEIHNKMETMLGEQGAYLDAIYYCPHHPDRGFDGERIEYKINCNCRKPKPGMLVQAAKDYNIDLQESWMVGDSVNDVLAGKRAGCKTAYITNQSEQESRDICVKSLVEFVEKFL